MLQGLEPHALFSCKIILITLYLQEIPQSENNFLSFFFPFSYHLSWQGIGKFPGKLCAPLPYLILKSLESISN